MCWTTTAVKASNERLSPRCKIFVETVLLLTMECDMAKRIRVKLSQDAIASAALAAIDETGDFTMSAVAERLSVRQSSLYNHVNGRGQIIELLTQRLHEEMAIRVDTAAHWPEVIRDVAYALRSSLAEHPLMIPMLATSPATLDASITTVENFATVLSRAGFADQDVLMIMAMVDIVAIGGSLDLVSPEQIYPDDVLAEVPVLARAIRSSASGSTRADSAFEFTLDLMIQSLWQRIG